MTEEEEEEKIELEIDRLANMMRFWIAKICQRGIVSVIMSSSYSMITWKTNNDYFLRKPQ
jgi:hypothetical protein